MRRMSSILLAVIAICIAGCDNRKGSVSVGTGASTIQQVHSSGSIRAGWAPYAPYVSLDKTTGKPAGFYIDVFERMADEAGLKVQWVETTWGTMIADLKTNRFDVMAAPTFKTIPRAKEVAFTRTIDYFGLSALVRKGEGRFKVPQDFNRADVTIALTEGEVGHEFAKRWLPQAKQKVFQTGNISLALVDVIQGRADAGISDAWTIKQFAREHKDEVVDLFGEQPFNKVGAGWFIRQGDPDFLLFLNTSIDWLDSSGALKALASKYELPSTLQ